jgi:glycosyltransferase involved in cell wall biosynthesis
LIEKEKASVELLEPIFKTSQIKKEYQTARIFIYPSLAEKGETFGLSILESMSMGCVPVVSALPCFNDITSSKCAFIIQKSESFESSLVETLSEILMAEPRHSILSSHAYEKSQEFAVDKVAEKFLNDFKKIL